MVELTFPFKNIAFNTLCSFFEKETIRQFADVARSSGLSLWDFNEEAEYFRDSLPNFESEILQIINTTNQETINRYFKELSAEVAYLKDHLDKDSFYQQIDSWNREAWDEYNSLVEQKENQYFQQEERTKYRHLEKYESSLPFPLLLYPGKSSHKTEKINCNFYCIEEKPEVVPIEDVDEYYTLLRKLATEFTDIAAKYRIPWLEGKIKANLTPIKLKPIVFFEGEHDITFVRKAAEFLDQKDVLDRVDLRQRGGSGELNKLWTNLTKDNWETVPQTKILIFDCDTNSQDQKSAHIFKKTIPSRPNSFIHKGIENLFPRKIVQNAIIHKKAFVDIKKIEGTERGESYTRCENVINKDEKKNFCNWICENGTKEDFENFSVIFEMIEEIINAMEATEDI